MILALWAQTAVGGKADLGTAMAFAQLRQNNPRMAISTFEKLLDKKPGNPALEIGLGRAYAQVGRCTRAVDLIGRHVDRPAFKAKGAVAAAECALALGDLAMASEYGSYANELNDPEDPAIPFQVALVAADAGDAALFYESLDTFEELGGSPGRRLTLVAREALARGDADTVTRELHFARRTLGYGPESAIVEARTWMMLDAPDAAAELLRPYRKLSLDRWDVSVFLAEARRRSGAAAMARFLLTTKRHSNDESVFRDAVLARISIDLQDPDWYETAMALLDRHPDHPEAIATGWYAAHQAGDQATEQRLGAILSLTAEAELLRPTVLIPISQR